MDVFTGIDLRIEEGDRTVEVKTAQELLQTMGFRQFLPVVAALLMTANRSLLWREVVTEEAKAYPDVELSHMYVDNCAMQLVRNPKQFDVIVTGNMFGDILSDEAAMLTGSIGMLPSASLNATNQGLYEPSHGSAPDIAGKGVANPLATILSAAMMLRFSLNQPQAADRIESAVKDVLSQGLRTADIFSDGTRKVGTREMGDAVVAAITKKTTKG